MFKKYRQLISGIVIGATVAGTGAVFAESQTVSAIIAPWIKFEFNGEQKQLDKEYDVLMHENHTYVPARFVAEKLGAKVEWNSKTSTLSFTKEQPSDTNESFKPLPIYQFLYDVSVEAYRIDVEDNYTKVYLRVENKSSLPMQLVQESAYMEANGTTYKVSQVNANKNTRDQTWYNNLPEDKEREGTIVLSNLPKDIRQGTLHVKVIQNDGSGKEIDYAFNLKW